MEEGETIRGRHRRTAGVHVGAVQGSITHSIIAGGNVVINALQQLEQGPRKARRLMLDRVERIWIAGLFSARMSESAEFSVPFATRLEGGRVQGQTACLPSAEDQQHVLILGEPGAGKTIFLLQIVRRRLEAARESASRPIPVVINASNWRERLAGRDAAQAARQFRSWVIRVVQTEYKIAPRIVEAWLDDAEIELFLDGMDEVSPELQDDFVTGLRAFQFNEPATIYLSCRVGEYQQITERVRAGGAGEAFEIFQADAVHELGPLSDEAVVEVIGSAGRLDMVASLAEREDLRELCRSPLFLSLLIRMEADVGQVSKPAELFEAAMNHAFAVRSPRLPQARIKQAMTSVAWLLEKKAQSTFHFSDLGSGAFDRGWQTGCLFTISALTGLGAVVWILTSLFSGDWGWGKWWFSAYVLVATITGLMSAADVKHQGLQFDALRGGKGALVGGGLGVALVLLQLVVALVVVIGVLLIDVQPLLALAVVAAIVILVFIWGANDGEPFSYVQGLAIAVILCGVVALVPLWLLEWLVTEGGHRYSKLAERAVFGLGFALSPPWHGALIHACLVALWAVWWRSTATLLAVALAIGFLVGALKPRAADRHTGWRRTVTGMTLGSLVAAVIATALVVAVIVIAQVAFGAQPNIGQRWRIGLAIAIGAFAASGGVAVLYYAVCRALLLAGGTFPGNFPLALQEAVRLGLMVRLGGSYAFIHKLQLEHLAYAPTVERIRRRG